MTTLTAYAPSYIPWKGVFDRISKADIFVLTDTDRYSPKDFHNRNRILLNGKPHWLTVPVLGGRDQRLCDVRVDNSKAWQRKHWGTLEQAYSKAPHWERFSPRLSELYATPYTHLWEQNDVGIHLLMDAYGLDVLTARASDHDIPGAGSEFILNVCKHFDADTYLCGAAGRAYLDVAAFEEAGVAVRVEEYQGAPVSAVHQLFTEGAVL